MALGILSLVGGSHRADGDSDDAPTSRERANDAAPPSIEDGDTRRERAAPVVPPPSAPSARIPGSRSALLDASGRRAAATQSTKRTDAYLQTLVASRIRPVMVLLVAIVPAGIAGTQYARNPTMRFVGIGGILLCTIATLVLHRVATRPETDPGRIKYNLAAVGLCLAVLPMIYYYGPFLPFCGIVGLVLLLYNLSAPPFWGILATMVIAVPHTAMHVAITAGVLPDLAMLNVTGPVGARLLNLVAVLIIYGMSLGVGQFYRRRTQATLADLEDAAQQVALREAMLREARLELEQAAGVGQPGRFTDQRLGSFVLGNILGRGGMGEVYEAMHADTGDEAAVKLIRRPEGSVENVIERFVREAEIAASLDSPYVVRVFEIGGAEAVLPFIAMERLRGVDLADILRTSARLPAAETVSMTTHIAEGLAAAKELGVVHRDIKPRNTFRCEDGTWKVLDFGVARLAGDTGELTGTGLVGTPPYMAPEQILSTADVDHRTDVHALGAVVYRALTGRPAFAAKEAAQVLQQVVESLPRAPSHVVRVPVSVDAVLRVALAKSMNDRFPDARELARALRAAFAGEQDAVLAQRASALRRELDWATDSGA